MTPATKTAQDNTAATSPRSEFIEALEKSPGDGSTDFVRFIAGQPEPSTERNRLRREAFFNTQFSICVERARYFTESFKQTEGEPQVLRMAKAFRTYLENVTIILDDNDLFAGYSGGKMLCSQIFPELSAAYLDEEAWEEAGNFNINPVEISDEEIAELKEMAPYWRGKSLQEFYGNMKPHNDDHVHQRGLIFAYNMLAGIGHMIVDVERGLKRGFKSIRDEALQKAERLRKHPEDALTPKKIAFYKAVATAIEGLITYAHRNADHAEQLAKKEEDERRRAELLRIADACRWVPEHPPRTFFEALQCMLLMLVANQMESCEISVCPGRMDQFLYPVYKKDIEEGTTTRQEVVELLENLQIRLGQSSWLYSGRQQGILFYPKRGNLVTITLSGKDKDGRDLTNELTYLIMHAHANNRLGHPTLAVRLHKNSPDALRQACARLIGTGSGQPGIMNDEVMIPALTRLGYEECDAYEYANIGCIEMGTAGTSIGPVSIGFVNLAKCLELALHNGRCPIFGEQVGPETGDARTFAGYDEVLDAYARQVHFAMTQFNQSVSAIEMGHELLRPIPFMSSITDNSMERGLDLTNGGSKYYFAGVEGIGVADVADSLAAIKKLVFDEQQITMTELVNALSGNFVDNERLRLMLLNGAPKFGNDDDFVDEIARESCSVYLREVKTHRDYWGSVYYPGIWSIELAMILGSSVGALPSGRNAFESLTEGVSPSRGCDRCGPTASVKSVAKLDQHLMENGSIFNMKFNPDTFKDENIEKFIDIMKTYFDLGGFQMQFSVVDQATLLDALENPEKYRDLVVRVAGYSAYFVEQSPRVQDHIIERTEHC
ncbi:MAG: formate C-acetyltransferase/glycerol dehydratase family glycyl radical enzyme [Candidatus Abyssubacteria bacterium]|nr:formate C-acetyltransferase/glycerol dehydratase family glycyl radical enzyme [Candidatus Abyssubacteria bacterium]